MMVGITMVRKITTCIKYGGQRLRTALCYLNNVEKGGGTKMTKLNITVNAEKGNYYFDNTYENSNIKHPLSEHAGLPVEEGENMRLIYGFENVVEVFI